MTGQRNGFTVIELLIVVAIIGILAAVLIPNVVAARGAAVDRAAQLYGANVHKAAFAYVGEDPDRNVVLGDCSSGYSAGAYSTDDPGSATVASCTVSDANGDNAPEVSVTSAQGRTFTFP